MVQMCQSASAKITSIAPVDFDAAFSLLQFHDLLPMLTGWLDRKLLFNHQSLTHETCPNLLRTGL